MTTEKGQRNTAVGIAVKVVIETAATHCTLLENILELYFTRESFSFWRIMLLEI